MKPALCISFSTAVQLIVAIPALAENVEFVRDVRPILQKHCYSCHGAEKQKSSLRLDIKSEAFKGGETYGPSIVAANVDGSPLLQLVREISKSKARDCHSLALFFRTR